MASIYELTGAYKRLEMAIALNPDEEELKAELAQINDDLETKADGYAKLIKNLEASRDAKRAEAKRLTDGANSIDNAINRLKNNLEESMRRTGKLKFKTDLFSFGIQKSGGLKPLIMNVGVSELPRELQKITVEPDNTAIRNYIAETGDITYAELGEASESLRIR